MIDPNEDDRAKHMVLSNFAFLVLNLRWDLYVLYTASAWERVTQGRVKTFACPFPLLCQICLSEKANIVWHLRKEN